MIARRAGLGNQGRNAVSGCEYNNLRDAGGEACRPACRREEHELASLVTIWPELPAPVRQAIITLAESARPSRDSRQQDG